MLPSMAPKGRRVTWLSANRNQYDRACLISRPPVFTDLCCKLVNDQQSILLGSASLRHRFPQLESVTLSHGRTSFDRNRRQLRRVIVTACLPPMVVAVATATVPLSIWNHTPASFMPRELESRAYLACPSSLVRSWEFSVIMNQDKALSR
jgi:hypothetical protein